MSGAAGDGRPTTTAAAPRPPRREVKVRRARLKTAHVDPWSATKLSFVLSIAFGIVLIVAVALLWFALDSLGAFSAVADTLRQITQDEDGNGFELLDYLGFGRVMSLTVLIAAINVVLLTLLGALFAVLYNLAASFTGGLQVTLTEDVNA